MKFPCLGEASFYKSGLLESSGFNSWNAHLAPPRQPPGAWIVTVIHTKPSPASYTHSSDLGAKTYAWLYPHICIHICVYLCVNGLIHTQYIHSHLYINTCNYRFSESTANTILLNANTHISAPQTHMCMLSGWTWVLPPHIPTNALNPAQTHLPDLRVEVWLESIEGGRECDKPARTELALLAFQEGRRQPHMLHVPNISIPPWPLGASQTS